MPGERHEGSPGSGLPAARCPGSNSASQARGHPQKQADILLTVPAQNTACHLFDDLNSY